MAEPALRRSRTLLLRDQTVAQLRLFVRIPVALFFTVALPVVMLVLFNLLFTGADSTVETATGAWPIQQFYAASLASFAVVSATFTNLANLIPDRRQDGVMKRWRGTPLPPSIYLAGFVGAALVVAVASLVLMLLLGVLAYDLRLDADKVPALVLAVAIGALAFSALGVAVAGLIRSQEAAPAVTNAIVLPLAFVSNTFIPIDDSALPGWLDGLSSALPLRPFVESVQAAFNPTVEAPAIDWSSLAVVTAWGAVGALVAARTFRWEPFADGGGGRRRRRRSGADRAAEGT